MEINFALAFVQANEYEGLSRERESKPDALLNSLSNYTQFESFLIIL